MEAVVAGGSRLRWRPAAAEGGAVNKASPRPAPNTVPARMGTAWGGTLGLGKKIHHKKDNKN